MKNMMRQFLAPILCVLMLLTCIVSSFADGDDVLEPSESGMLYTIQFVMYDAFGGNRTVLQQCSVPYGETPVYSGPNPFRAVPEEYEDVFEHYDFVGWDPEIGPVTGEAEYTAQFEPVEKLFTVQYIDGNGTVLQSEQLSTESYIFMYSGETPTKTSTAEFDYEFTGWNPVPQEGMLVEQGRTFRAQFKEIRRSYTITWQDDTGKVIDTTTVEYGKVPTHTDAVKEGTDGITYTFAGWDPAPVAVKEAATYKATFDAVNANSNYTVKVYNGKGSGSYPAGAKVTISADMPAEGKQFISWTGTDGLDFTSGSADTTTATFTMPQRTVTVTATYKTVPITLILNSNCDGIANQSFQNITSISLPALVRSGYAFLGRAKTPGGDVIYNAGDTFTLTSDLTLFAKWAKLYKITWLDSINGSTSAITYVEHGKVPVPPLAATDVSAYPLKGWYPTLTAATKDATYGAIWDTNHPLLESILSNRSDSEDESNLRSTSTMEDTNAIAEKAESKQDNLAKAEKGEAKTSKTIETVEAVDDDGEGALVCLGGLTPSVTDEMKADFSTLADMLITASAKPSNFDRLINYFVQDEGCAMSASEPCRVVASTYPVTVTISLDNPEDFVGIMAYQYDKYSNPPEWSNETKIDVIINDDGTVTFVLDNPSVLCFVYKIIEDPAPQGGTDTAGPVSGQEGPSAPAAEGDNASDHNDPLSPDSVWTIVNSMDEKQRAVFINALKTAMNTATLRDQAAEAADDFDSFIIQVIMELGPDAANASAASVKKAATKILKNGQFGSNNSNGSLTVTKAAGGKYNITYNGTLAPQENTPVKGVEATDNTSAARSEIGPGTPSGEFYINGVQSNHVIVTMSSNPMAEALFKSSTPTGWNCSSSYALSANGKSDNTLKYGVLRMAIPSQLQKDGRQFMIMFMDKNGKVHVLNDSDLDPATITVNLAIEAYQFGLCYKD